MTHFKGFSKLWFLAALLLTFVVGCSGSSSSSAPDVTSAKALSAFSLAGVAGTINEPGQTISVTLPYGTSVTAVPAVFTTTGTTVRVGAVTQTSAVTRNNFAGPVEYTVTAADMTTAKYTVTVSIAPNSAKGFSAFAFVGLAGSAGVINEPSRTIAVTVPFGTNTATLAAAYTTTGTEVKVNDLAQISGTTVNDFSLPVVYTVSAADNKSTTYTVNVTIATNPAKSITAYSFVGFTGFAGTINEPAKTIAVNLPYGTSLTNLIGSYTTTGTAVKVSDVSQVSGATAHNFTSPVLYTVTAADTTSVSYSVSVTIAANPAKAITAYSFGGFTAAAGAIDELAKTIVVTVPFGTNVTNQVATFTTSAPVLKVGAQVQTSSATPNDFTHPVVYTLTAADASTVAYTVSVIVAKNPAKAISAYSFVGFTGFAGTVTESTRTIAVTVPFGTNVTALVATFTTTGTGVKVGTAVQTSTATANDFTLPKIYTVTADDASTADYTVTVTIAPNPAKAITAFSFTGFAGAGRTINEVDKTIAVVLPFGSTDVTALIAEFTTTGTGVKVGSAIQTSTTTANDFTTPVVYTVTAADGTSTNYTVAVSVAAAIPVAGINLGTSANYAILAKTGVSTVPTSAVTGNVGLSPALTAALTGWALTTDVTNTFSTSPTQVIGAFKLYAADNVGGSTVANLTTAVADMETAYTAAAGRIATSAATTEVGAGTVTGLTLAPGVYQWSGAVTIPTDLTLAGNATDVWIFKVGSTLDMAANKTVILSGGAQAKNIFWQVAGAVDIGAGTRFEGTILGKTSITLGNLAQINGRLLAQTLVALSASTVTAP